MIITQEDLIRRLAERGYEMTPRRVTDWVARGVLPPRHERGRGQAKGKVYYWESPDVVDQATAAIDLLEWRGRIADIYAPLACLGYSVPISELRENLARWIDRMAPLDPDEFENSEELASWLHMIAVTDSSHRSRRGGLFDSIEHGEGYLNAFLNPTYDLTRQQLEAMNLGDDVVTWLRRYISYPNQRSALRKATDVELAEAVRDWQVILSWLHPIAALFGWDTETARPLRRIMAMKVLPLVLLALLTARQLGDGEKVDEFMWTIADLSTEMMERTRAKPELEADFERAKEAIGLLANRLSPQFR